MISRQNKITNSVTRRKRTSNVSLFFRYLTRFCIFPIDADYEKNALRFSFLSKKMIILTIICFSIPIIGTLLPMIFIGFDRVMPYYENLNATPTDTVSLYGIFLTITVFSVYYVFFIKKIGIGKTLLRTTA